MMTTITQAQQASIANYFRGHDIPAGLGDKGSACSIAGINLALSGRLTDEIPECMSPVIGRWIIGVQDAMPNAMRNSDAWRDLLPLAAGTGRDSAAEKARHAVIMDWMWGTVLPTLQPLADAQGFGAEWLHMTTERTSIAAKAVNVAYTSANAAHDAACASTNASYEAAKAAHDATNASYEAANAAYYAANASYDAANSAYYAANAAYDAANVAYDAAYDAYEADYAAYDAAYVAYYAANAATNAICAATNVAAWEAFNPCRLLQQLIEAAARECASA